MVQKNERRNFKDELNEKNFKQDEEDDINIKEFAAKLGIHPLVLYIWQTQSEDMEKIPTEDEIFPVSYKVNTAQDLLNRYFIHRWKNQYFNLSEPFEINPEIINAKGLQYELLLMKINRPAYGLYNEKSWLIDLLPGYPELEPMIKELRHSKSIDFPTATKIYEEWQNKISKQMNSEENEAQKSINKLSIRDLCFAILEYYDYRKIHLADREIASYAKYYHKMNELYYHEIQELTDTEKQNFLIERMLEWSVKFEKAASEYIILKKKLISKSMKKAFAFNQELGNRFQDLYRFLNSYDIRFSNFYYPIKNLVSEMLVYQAICKNRLESDDQVFKDRIDVGAPPKDMEREFISDLDNTIKENKIHFSKYSPSRDKGEWIADLLNLLSNLKDREWQLYGNLTGFPFRNYKDDKIYKTLNISKHEEK